MTNVRMPRTGRLLVVGWVLIAALRGWSASTPDFREDFSKLPTGKLPDTFLVLDGQFAVREEASDRFVELPGAPLETFGVMFGPARKENWGAKARIQGTGQGRRFPVFGLSLNGVAGYRLQVAPAKKALELLKGDEVRATSPMTWESGMWTVLRVQIRKAASGGWVVEGKAWKDGSPEPASWMVTWNETEEPVNGRAAVWGKPFSGTPLRFDDFEVRVGME
ncbi:MAG: hypothetical protein JNK85_02675 [Verrucomicrobiales bacterium]|nr:hypothetical protein [Verrucomicrobiales bacterium]